MTRYDKLVRDKIPEKIAARGETAKWHVADGAEYWQKLKEKLAEEVAEFQTAESLEELADLLEVVDAVIAHRGFDRVALAAAQLEKREKRGGFSARIILEES